MAKIPPQLQDQIMKLQQLQQRMEMLVAQRRQLEQELKQTESALSELETLETDALVYKNIGAILVKANREKV